LTFLQLLSEGEGFCQEKKLIEQFMIYVIFLETKISQSTLCRDRHPAKLGLYKKRLETNTNGHASNFFSLWPASER